jgi:hypothetical protein
MVHFQVPLPGLSRDIRTLTAEEKDFLNYFCTIDSSRIFPVVDCYAGVGPKGYGASLILARIIKIRERILSDRQLAKCLKKNDLYRFVTQDIQPSLNSFNTLRKRLGPKGFVEIHKRFVSKAHSLGLLKPEIKELPKNRKKGIILVADSTFLITSGSTRGEKDQLGVPLITLLSPANISDQDIILYLIEELVDRYPKLEFSYIILDRGYDTEEIHHDIYEFFGIIAVIIRKKMVYPKGFNKDGYPLCPWGFAMKTKVIDYQRKRTRYACFKVCKKSKQPLLFACDYIKEQLKLGYSKYTYFKNGYRKFGPAVPHSLIYKKLKPFRTGIERTFGLVKENRYFMSKELLVL